MREIWAPKHYRLNLLRRAFFIAHANIIITAKNYQKIHFYTEGYTQENNVIFKNFPIPQYGLRFRKFH